MSNRSPAMQFYFRQFSGDEAVLGMDLDAVGAHILLMCMAGASEHGYKIWHDERAIRVRLRNPSDADFLRIKTQLLAGCWKVSHDGNWWIQDGMRRSLLKQKEFSKKQTENARKRWDAKPMPEPMPEPMLETCSSSASISISANNINREKKPKKKRIKEPKYNEFSEADFPDIPATMAASLKAWVEFKAKIGTPCLLTSYRAEVAEFTNQPDFFTKLVSRAIRKSWKGLNEQIPFEQATSGYSNNGKSKHEAEEARIEALYQKALAEDLANETS